jgi:mannosyltransferase OCH1-like enzyme
MKKCIKSWKKYCPDWEIVLWNEDNFDVDSTLWTKQAYEARKYAFVADYVRLKALYEQGGVYLDTDVEIVQPIDRFLDHEAFSGFESGDTVQTGIIGAKKGHPIIASWLEWYTDRSYLVDGKPEMVPNVSFITDNLMVRGLKMDDRKQVVDGMVIYPQTWFCPLSAVSIEKKITADTYVLHYFTSTWRTEKARKDFARVKRHQRWWYKAWEQIKILPQKTFRKIFGNAAMEKLKKKLGK